jgi:hypothetical protein
MGAKPAFRPAWLKVRDRSADFPLFVLNSKSRRPLSAKLRMTHPLSADQNAMISRPLVPPASNRRCASPACSGG